MSLPNPYEVPNEVDAKVVAKTRWQLIPTIPLALFGVLLAVGGPVVLCGCAANIIGILLHHQRGSLWEVPLFRDAISGIFAGSLLFVAGVLLLIGAYTSWKTRWRAAIISAFCGLALWGAVCGALGVFNNP